MTNKVKILLIDKDEMTQIYFKDIFWIHGRNKFYEVDIASSLGEAERKIEDLTTRPNTIFFDIMIGFEDKKKILDKQLEKAVLFVDKIKKDNKKSDIKIIIFSNQEEKYIKKKFPSVEFDGYIKKGDLMPKEIIDYTDKIHGTNNKN
jgi:CheY-like chemotaxis protein